jgi:predicted membrane protein
MDFISVHMHTAGVFWGIMILILGLLLIIRQLFNLEFPVGKVMIGVLFIGFGVKLLFFGPNHQRIHRHQIDEGSVVFGNKDMKYIEGQYEYNIVFSGSTIDLRDIEEIPGHQIEINAVFGEAKVLLDDYMKVDINSDAVFGAVKYPERETDNAADSNLTKQRLRIQASAVFGNIKFIRD